MVHPEQRFFPLQQQTTSETAIRTNFLADLYVALGDRDATGNWTLRAYWKPLVPWIWIGAVIMAFGGMVSLSDRRWRVGVAARARAACRAGATARAGRMSAHAPRACILLPLLLFMVLAGYFALALRPGLRPARAALGDDRQAGAGVRPGGPGRRGPCAATR